MTLYIRSPLSLRNVEDLLHERGIEFSREMVRFWWKRFGPMFAAAIGGQLFETIHAIATDGGTRTRFT